MLRPPATALFLSAAILAVPLVSLATIGVGVGSGKIVLNNALVPGGIYTLPAIPVINTGDEQSNYAMDIEYLQDQPQLEPSEAWFTFSPEQFSLQSAKVQTVVVHLAIPLKAKPGDYFAYIEAHPVLVKKAGGTSTVNIAAASKLYFSIAPANIFEALWYRATGLYAQYHPWDTFGVVAVLFLLGANYLRKRVHIEIGVRQK